MNSSVLHSESTLTSRYQTTIPEPVRKVLKLHKHDKISYDILTDGRVVLTRTTEDASDPILNNFLDFLEQDIISHPDHIQPVTQKLLEEAEALTGNIKEVNLDEPLPSEDE